jgi:plasmid stabilization system protein ParE
MQSIYKVTWSNEAHSGFAETLNYLENRFTDREVKKFVKAFDDQINRIISNPITFRTSKKSKTIRAALVAKLTSIYYTFNEESIYLVAIRDNRESPVQ